MRNPHRSPLPSEPTPDPRGRRAVLMPMLVAMAGVAIVATYLYWEEMTRMPPRLGRIGTLAYSDNAAGDGDGYRDEGEGARPDWASVMGTDPKRLLAVHPGDRALSPAEAVLPPHPQAEHFMGVRRTAEGLVEELMMYRVPHGEIEAVRRHCQDAAAAAGFEIQPAASEHSDLFVRAWTPAAGGAPLQQTLIVRVTARDDEIRAVVWLRYAMTRRR